MIQKILILLGVVTCTYGYCFSSNGRVDKTASGQFIPVCEYNGLDLLDGSSFKTAGCTECRCNKGVLHCCGYGINAGKIAPPPGCRLVADGCRPVMVMETDETRDCFTGQPVKYGKMDPTLPSLPFPFPGMDQLQMKGSVTETKTIDPYDMALIQQLTAKNKQRVVDPLLKALSDQLMATNAQGNRMVDMSSTSQTENQPKQGDNLLNDILFLQGMNEL